MSRALDQEVAASLSDGNILAAYKAISQVVNPPASSLSPLDELLEFEILPKSHQLDAGTHLLRDGPAIAVSKLSLVQAFLVGRKVLHEHIGKERDPTEEDVFAATAVIWLMDPEHLTAANARKRLIQAGLSDLEESKRLIGREKYILDSLLTSRLHRHTKSPTLWSHRQWLLRIARSMDIPLDIFEDVTRVNMVAAKRHPRNYYAWYYARWLIGPSGMGEGVTERLIPAVKDWCFRNHTDISGWTFLYHLFDLGGPPLRETCGKVFDEVLTLAVSLRWTNESVWVFLRTLAASGLLGETEYAAFLTSNKTLIDISQDQAARAVLERALAWSEKYRRSDS